MKEVWMHKIWKNKWLNTSSLMTANGKELQIIFQGIYNYAQGPDFLQSRIQIEEIQWLGAIEIHLKSSDWYQHEHQLDKNYNSVVLHVVWEMNTQIFREDGTEVPQLVLEKYVDAFFLDHIHELEKPIEALPCSTQLANVPKFIQTSALHTTAFTRLQRKTQQIQESITKEGWEQSFHLAIAKGFGGKQNGEAFMRIAQTLNVSVINKVKSSQENLFAILAGISGLLNSLVLDDYTNNLYQTWLFLKEKYKIAAFSNFNLYWKCRPAEFPSFRLAQWAAFLQQYSFDYEWNSKPMLNIDEYWQTHYVFGKKTLPHSTQPGKQFWSSFELNYVLPARLAWIQQYGNEENEAILWEHYYEQPKENNRITRLFEAAGFTIGNGLESQGCIELYTQLCSTQSCHHCIIGNHILSRIFHLSESTKVQII